MSTANKLLALKASLVGIHLALFVLFMNHYLLAQPAAMDPTFDPGEGVNYVMDVALQQDGKVVIVGGNHLFDGVARNGIARLEPNGSLDTTFDPGIGLTSGGANCIALDASGHVFIGGELTMYNGIERHKLAKLNADGSLDLSFTPRVLSNVGGGTGNTIGTIYSIAAQPDGKILVGGQFTAYDGFPCRCIVRINADGSFDDTFNVGTGASHVVYSVVLEPNGKVLLGGSFYSINGTSRQHIARINPDGSLDDTFDPGSGFYGSSSVKSISLQSDGNIIVGGDFTSYDGTECRLVARLLPDGELDTSFDAELPGNVGSNSQVETTAIQQDGKVIVGGWFNPLYKNIARLNVDGSYDDTFDPGVGFNFRVYAARLQLDGKILVGGQFTTYDEVDRKGVVRLLGGDANGIGINENDDRTSLELWPNPTKGEELWVLTKNIPDGTLLDIEVVNLQGKSLKRQGALILSGLGINPVDLRGLADGMYVLRFVTESKRFGHRFVIEH